MSKMRLGIDIGVASLGWCLYSLRDDKNKAGKPITEIDGVVDAGVRIFSDSRSREQGKQHLPLNVARRESRLGSRGRDRYLQRRDALMRYLVRYGLMPEDRATRKRLEKLNPYELRAWAITDGKSPCPKFKPQHLVGRAIFHLNQRRGFKSNRQSERRKPEENAKAIEKSMEKFRVQMEEKGCQTAGEFLWKIHDGKSVRARPHFTGTGINLRVDFYDYYCDRALLEAEFDAIWEKQTNIHPQMFTDEHGRVLRKIIFHQRPLAPAVVGKCTFYGEEYRARKGLPSYQRFRILQEVNNLRFRSGKGKERLREDARKEITGRLLEWRGLQADDGLLHFDEMKKIVELRGVAVTSIFTTASARRPGLFGDKTSHILRGKNFVGTEWDKWPIEKRDRLVDLILDPSAEDEKTTAKIIKDYGLDSEQAKKCVDADTRLKKEYGELSLRAIKEILPHLEKGLIYKEAVEAAGLGSHSDRQTEFDGSMPSLPQYQEVLPQYCNPLRKRDEDNPKTHRISNPTVHVGLNQLRLVVNDIIRIHGKPTEIVVELAREFGMGKIGKEDYDFLQSRLQAENTRRRKKIEEMNLPANPENMLKFRLWEELNSNPCHRCCVYTGKHIGPTALFSDAVEIEHILPFSKTGDNSFANKTLCCRIANRTKGDRTPHEEFGESAGYEQILNRAKQFVPDSALESLHYRRERRKGKKNPTYDNRKWHRFLPNAKEKFLGEHDDFTERYLNETQFLSRAAKQYLEAICPRNNIWVIHGGLTALIRRGMGLDSILNDDEQTQKKRADKEEAKRQKGGLYRGKNRNDHRHHAIDAAVIGATSRSLLLELATEAKKMEDIHSKRFAKTVREAIEKRRIDLHDKITEKINDITISHKPQRGRNSQLHKEFAYRILHDEDKKEGVYTREVVRSGKTSKINAVPIKDRAGKYYKAYESGSNWACEIYRTENGKWDGEVITTFDANRKSTKGKDRRKVPEYYSFIPRWRQDNPTAKLIMRIHSGDLLAIEKGGKKRVVRVQKMDILNRIYFADHIEANTANRTDARTKLGMTMGKWDNAKCEQFRMLLKNNSGATVRDILTSRDSEWKFSRPQTDACLSAWAKIESKRQEKPIQTDEEKKEFIKKFLGKMLGLENMNPGGLKRAKARKIHISPAGRVYDSARNKDKS